jgi:hypothetical protein
LHLCVSLRNSDVLDLHLLLETSSTRKNAQISGKVHKSCFSDIKQGPSRLQSVKIRIANDFLPVPLRLGALRY